MTARDRLVVGIVVVVAAIVATWFFAIQPKRSQASKLGSQISSLQSQLSSAQSEVARGEAARATFSTNYTQLARLGQAVPADDNTPSLIYQLQGAASSTGVDFRSLVFNPSASGSTGSAPPPPSSTSAGNAAVSQTASATLPPGAGIGPAGFPVQPFTFTFQGNFFHLSSFFKRLEDFVVANNNKVTVSGRLMTLNAISFAAAPEGFPQITATISATTYLVPASEGLLNGATPAGPATSTHPVSNSSAGSSSVAPAAVSAP